MLIKRGKRGVVNGGEEFYQVRSNNGIISTRTVQIDVDAALLCSAFWLVLILIN